MGQIPRILIIDDEPLIALDVGELLLESGFAVAGAVGNIESALALIESGACDAVILDSNLAGVSSAAIAFALAAHDVPYLVLSGYSHEQLPAGLQRAPYLRKPFRAAQLIGVLTDLCKKHK